jgi:hypothetical protein
LDGEPQFAAPWSDDARLLKIALTPQAQARLNQAVRHAAPGELWLMDPLGNVMMRYPVGFDPYHVRDDLNKLLKISQIG